MPNFTYNAGSLGLQNGSIAFLSGTIKIALVRPGYVPDKDHASLTPIAAQEVNIGGYAPGFGGTGRKTLANKTLTNDTTNDRTKYDADDPAPWTLATGDTVAGAVIYYHTVDDASSVPLFFYDIADFTTNGSAFPLQFHADGMAYTQQ